MPVRAKENSLRELVSELSTRETLRYAEVVPAAIVTLTGIVEKSALGTAASSLPERLLLGATMATPVTWMSPREPNRLQTSIEACTYMHEEIENKHR